MINAVFDFATIAVVLTLDAASVVATLGHTRFVNGADRYGMGVLGGDDFLTPIANGCFVPGDRFEQSLQGSRPDILVQRHRFDVLSLHIGEQPPHVEGHQRSARRAGKAIGKERQKLGEQSSEISDIFEQHESDLPWFRVCETEHTEGRFFFALGSRSINPGCAKA
jgi:hypothetical protein